MNSIFKRLFSFSIAIVRYVTREFPVADHWYPKNSKLQAQADVYLEWQHINIRYCCASYFQHKVSLEINKNKTMDRNSFFRLTIFQ